MVAVGDSQYFSYGTVLARWRLLIPHTAQVAELVARYGGPDLATFEEH
jgi:hypothetical protein